MFRRHAVLMVVAAVVAAASGCSTELDSPSADTVSVGRTVGAPALNDDDAPAGPLPGPGEDDTILDTEPFQPSELGSCSVQVTGDDPAAWQVAATEDSITYGGWYSKEARDIAAQNSTVLDESYFALTCRGAGDRSISFTGNGRVPQRPATYRFTLTADGATQSPRDRIAVVLSLPDAGLLALGGNGTLTITEFDDEHIAGSFDLPFVDAVGAAAQVTGSFDLINSELLQVPPTTG